MVVVKHRRNMIPASVTMGYNSKVQHESNSTITSSFRQKFVMPTVKTKAT